MPNKVLNEDRMLTELADAMFAQDSAKIADIMAKDLEGESAPEPTPTPEDQAAADAATNETVDTPGTEEPKDAPDDWRDKLPEDIRDRVTSEFNSLTESYRSLEHYRKSNEGRVAGLNRKIEELENKLRSASSPPPAPTPTPAPAKPEATPATDELDPIMQELKEADPALYNAINILRKKDEERFERKIKEVESRVDTQLRTTIDPIRQREQDAYVNQQAQIVKEAVPEIDKVLRSEEWKAFVNAAPPSVRQLADSPHAEDFLTAVDAFTMHLYRTAPPELTQQPSSAADKVQETRNRRLAASTPTNRSPAITGAQELDEAQFLERKFQELWTANKPSR